MYMELTVTHYTLQLAFDPQSQGSSIVVRMPDGVEAFCTFQDGLPSLLEGMCGRRWWQAHRDEIAQELAQRGLTIEGTPAQP